MIFHCMACDKPVPNRNVTQLPVVDLNTKFVIWCHGEEETRNLSIAAVLLNRDDTLYGVFYPEETNGRQEG